jgi:hypothetical protein
MDAMRNATRRRLMAALAVGLVMTMTGCGAADSTGSAPTGDALYRAGEKHFVDYTTVMHSVIMAIHEGDWSVDTYGASPIPCRIDGEVAGYAFSWVRMLQPEQVDVRAVARASGRAFEAAGMKVETASRGSGDGAEVTVVATGGAVGRGVVTIRPARGTIEASAATDCFRGDAGDLSDMVFGGLIYDTSWQRFPAFEGPDWSPRFYFPEDGSPVYRDDDGTPVEPQPASTDLPVAPYDAS